MTYFRRGRSMGSAVTCVCVQALIMLQPTWTVAQTTTIDACADFSNDEYEGSSWKLRDCIEVWKRYTQSAPYHERRLPHVGIWKNTAAELRKVGAPCLVSSPPSLDGVGSSTIRHLDTWILAEELGCDWASPDWGSKRIATGTAQDGSVVYCHRTATKDEIDETRLKDDKVVMRRCSLVNWLDYFQFGTPSVPRPANDTSTKTIEISAHSADTLMETQKELAETGYETRPWERLMITFHMSFPSNHLLSIGSWDESRRQTVRRVLKEARANFHRSPRPWYEEDGDCSYDRARLNFAFHVRLGDRRAFQGGDVEYFQLLELVMETISAVVVDKGMLQPLFHVFSETLMPCPTPDEGLFDEFPIWPVELDKINECLDMEAPEDCPEKRAGLGFCTPARSGIFRVKYKPIVLHVGTDVRSALSCMIQADGVMMGCSTFGQVAGLLTNGISMFSMECGGSNTPVQYKTIPPLAVAERGHMWVPVSGSWRDPVLVSMEIFKGTLNMYLKSIDSSRLGRL